MKKNERRYSTGDLATKYFVSDKTIRNYIDRIAEIFGFDKDLLKVMNEKGNLEYSLTAEQEQLIGLLIRGIEKDPYLKKVNDIEKIREMDIRDYRDEFINKIEQLEDEDLKESIKNSKTYQLGKRLKDIYIQKEEVQDAFLFLIEHIPLEERVNMEEKLLEADKKVVMYLMDRFIKQVEKEAYKSLMSEEEKDEDGFYDLIEWSEEQLHKKVREILDKKFKKRALIDNHYAGYSLFEKAISEALKETMRKEKNGD